VGMTVTEDENLGPFQAFWNAWSAADAEIKSKDLLYFSSAVVIQFEEMSAHLERKDRDAAAREATDVISVALNTLRWLDFDPAQIAQIARDRARNRMDGKTHEILEKYEKYEKQHRC